MVQVLHVEIVENKDMGENMRYITTNQILKNAYTKKKKKLETESVKNVHIPTSHKIFFNTSGSR